MAKYPPQTWTDDVSSASAARMAVIENGIREASMGRSTTFPATPVDGDIHVYPADTTLGVMWHFMYRSGSASAHKWELIGGASLSHEVLTSETRNNAAYGDLATAGPTLTVPKAGDYLVSFGCSMFQPGSVAASSSAAIKRGAAATSDNDRVNFDSPSSASGQEASFARTIRVNGLAASDVIKIQYKNNAAGTTAFSRRWLEVTPIRVTP